MIRILIALLPTLTLQTCVSLVKDPKLYPAKGEQKFWEMTTLYSGKDLKYSFKEEPDFFKIETPIFEVAEPVNHKEAGSDMLAMRPLVQPENGAWLNHFIFMEEHFEEKSVDIYYAEGSPMDSDKPANFNNKVNFLLNEPDIKCFDVDYISADVFVADCSDQSLADPEHPFEKNYFYVVLKGDDPAKAKARRQETTNYKGYKKTTYRKIQYHEYYSQNIGTVGEDLQKVLLRGSIAYGTDKGTPAKLDTDCVLEVFKVDANNVITDTLHHLDKSVIADDVNAPDHENFKFQLVDFKIQTNGDIYILDAANGIYVYRLTSVGNWVFKEWIQTMAGTAYAFDFNYRLNADGSYYKHLVVLYDQYMIVLKNNAFENGYVLPFGSVFPARISISQKYIVAVSKGIVHLYSSDSQFLISTKSLDYITFAINPYEPDLVVITNANSHRYLISHGFLTVKPTVSTADTAEFTLVATDENKDECLIKVTYKVLDPLDSTIYDMGVTPFPDVITFPADPFYLDKVAAGPALHFTNLVKLAADTVDVKVYSLWDLHVSGIVWPNAADVQYADILEDPHHSNKFYMLIQTKDKKAAIWDCVSDKKTDDLCTCEIQDQFHLETLLVRGKSSWSWWSDYQEQITYVFLDSDYSFGIYVSHEGQSEKLAEITYEAVEKNKITSVVLLQDVFYIVQNGLKTIKAYTSLIGTPKFFEINEAMVKKQGYTGTWNPKRVFGNKDVKSQLLWILNDDFVLLADYKKTFTLIKQFPIFLNADVEVAIGENSFIIVQKTATQTKIEEFNYANLNKIYITKQLPLFGKYTVQSPLTADFSSHTGFLYLRALETATQKTVILVYQPNELSHNCLLKVIQTNVLVEEGTPLDLAVTGGEQMFIYLNNFKQQRILSLLEDAVMTLQPSGLSTDYVTQLAVGVKITNFEGNKAFDSTSNVKFLNTHSIISINQNTLSNTNRQYNVVNQETDQLIPLKSDWYGGQVVKFEIQCVQCESGLIQLQNPIYHHDEDVDFAPYKIKDGAPYGTGMVYQTETQLLYQDKEADLKQVVNLEATSQFVCDNLAVSDDQKYVISGCSTQTYQALFISQCSETAGKFACTRLLQGLTNVKGVDRIGKIIFKGDMIFILNSEPTYPSTVGTVNAYKFTQSNTEWTLTDTKVINQEYLSAPFSISIADFDVLSYTIGNVLYYKIVLTDAKTGLWFVDLQPNIGQAAAKYIAHEDFNLYAFLNSNQAKQIARADTYFYQVRTVQQTEIQANLMTITFIVSTNNVAQYGISINFDVSAADTKGAKLVLGSGKVPFLLNQYGTYNGLNKMAYSKGYAAVAYNDKAKANLLVAVYKLPTTYKENEMITFLGGEEQPYQYPLAHGFVMALQAIGEKTYLHTNIIFGINSQNHLLIKYGIETEPMLHVQNGHKVAEQKVTISGHNTFSNASGYVQLKSVNPPKPPGPDDGDSKGSSNWWWITLIVVFGLLALGVGGFFAYKKFGNQHVEPLLD